MKTRIIITIAALLSCATTNAQNITGYWNSSYIHADEVNPAFIPDCKTYISLPGAQFGFQSSIGAYSLLYPAGNGFVTGLHQSVSSEEFLGRIAESARIGADGYARVFGIGRKTGERSFMSASVKMRGTGDANIPSEVFRLLKDGSTESENFDLSCTAYSGDVYGEIAIGAVHSFGSVTVGAKIKLLQGIARSRMELDRLSVTTGSDRWTFEGEGFINSALNGLNPGAAADLGITARVNDHLTISAAVQDLGGIAWSAASYYRLPGGQWEYSGLEEEIEIMDSEGTDGLGSKMESAFNGLRSKLEFVRDGENAKEYKSLPMSFNAAFKYTLPSWEKLSLGAVAVHRGNGTTDVRAIADVAALRWWETSASIGMSTNGLSGGILTVVKLGPVRAHLGGELLGSRYGRFSGLIVPIDKVRVMADFGIQIAFR